MVVAWAHAARRALEGLSAPLVLVRVRAVSGILIWVSGARARIHVRNLGLSLGPLRMAWGLPGRARVVVVYRVGRVGL